MYLLQVAEMVFESVQSNAHLVMLALRLVRAQPANLAMMDRSVNAA